MRAPKDPPAKARVEPGHEVDAAAVILDAAQRLFLDDGYDGVSLEQVGRAAGVTRQTVYNRFGSKDAVFRAVIERHWRVVRARGGSLFLRRVR